MQPADSQTANQPAHHPINPVYRHSSPFGWPPAALAAVMRQQRTQCQDDALFRPVGRTAHTERDLNLCAIVRSIEIMPSHAYAFPNRICDAASGASGAASSESGCQWLFYAPAESERDNQMRCHSEPGNKTALFYMQMPRDSIIIRLFAING